MNYGLISGPPVYNACVSFFSAGDQHECEQFGCSSFFFLCWVDGLLTVE